MTCHIAMGFNLELKTLGRKRTSTVASLVAHIQRLDAAHARFAFLVHACAAEAPDVPLGAPLDPDAALCDVAEEGAHLLLLRSCVWVTFPCGLAADLRVFIDLRSATAHVQDLKDAVAAQVALPGFAGAYHLHALVTDAGAPAAAGAAPSPEPLPESALLRALALPSGSWLAALPLPPPPQRRLAGRAAQPWRGHSAPVRALALLPGGELVASAASDGCVRLWQGATGACVAALGLRSAAAGADMGGEAEDINALCVLEDGHLAAGGSEGYVRVLHLTLPVAAAAAAAAATAAAAAAATGRAAPLPLPLPPSDLSTLACFPGHDHSGPPTVRALLPLPHNCCAVATACRAIRLFCVHYQPREEKEAGGWVRQGAAPVGVLRGHLQDVLALAALPRERMASGSADGTVRIWALGEALECARKVLAARRGSEEAAAASVAAAAGGGSACLAVLRGCEEWVGALAVLPSGLLLSGSGEGTLRVWDTEAVVGPGVVGCCVGAMRGVGGGGLAAVAVLRDGRAAAGGYRGSVALWDCEERCCSTELECEGGATHALLALECGRLLRGAEDGCVHVYR